MAKKEVPVNHLQNYLPPGTGEVVMAYLHQHNVHLTVSRERKTILGDYRHRTNNTNHRISINGNLNRYSFLITLLHELGHLLTFEKYNNRVQPHGKEWKIIYGQMLQAFVAKKIFPADIESALLHSLKNPAASSCAEAGLLRVLRNYDVKKIVSGNGTERHHCLVEEVIPGNLFQTSDGRIFEKGAKLRKRFKCKEVKTGKFYLFSPVYEVEIIQNEEL